VFDKATTPEASTVIFKTLEKNIYKWKKKLAFVHGSMWRYKHTRSNLFFVNNRSGTFFVCSRCKFIIPFCAMRFFYSGSEEVLSLQIGHVI
jgi:hypothetical protein